MPPPGSPLPTGTVTFLFTDIEGSTDLARTLGSRWTQVLEHHHEILRTAIRDSGGIDVRTEGDSFFAVFASAVDAIIGAAAAQRALARHPWPPGGLVRVRMGMHTGEGRLGGDEYVGLDVHRAARIAASAHGGQVVLSDANRAVVGDALPDGVTLRDLGEHRLKDFDQPQRIHQLVIEGLPADFPPLRTLDVPSNLPVQLTSFVGREAELAALADLVERYRLLTLTGTGGAGKTRLALRVAHRRLGEHPDGVFFVDLSPIRDPDLVPSAMVHALGLKEQPGRPALDTLKSHLADRRVLLIVDNFEQVVEAASLIGEIIRSAPAIALLVTSRVRLDLAGEHVFPVPPLSLPADTSDPQTVASNEAAVLFRERARAVRPGFEITADNAQLVADICARLDGLPLAIELAAAQLRLLSPSEMLTRLEHRLPLRTGARDVPERQRTLRSTIDWSYRLLGEPQRKLLARLSVFAGGGTTTAIEAVCNPGGDLGFEALDGLETLFDTSLIRREESPEGSRFTMLETIREYADERLRTEFDVGGNQRRHAEFFAAHAERWGTRVRGEDAVAAFDALARDYQNIRAAIEWSLREDHADVGFRIGAAMWRFWVERGPLGEGRRAVEALLQLPSAAALDELRAGALDALGALAYWEADYRIARRAYAEALEIFRETGDSRDLAETLLDLAYALAASGDPEAAISVVEEAQGIASTIGDPRLSARAHNVLGVTWRHLGKLDRSLAALQESLKMLEAVGDTYWVKETLSRLGSVFMDMGRLDEAEESLRRSLDQVPRVPGAVGTGATIWILAAVAFKRNDFERALRLMGFSQAMTDRMGSSPPAQLLGDHASHMESARRALGQEAVARLRAEGAAMSPEEAIDYAIQEA